MTGPKEADRFIIRFDKGKLKMYKLERVEWDEIFCDEGVVVRRGRFKWRIK